MESESPLRCGGRGCGVTEPERGAEPALKGPEAGDEVCVFPKQVAAGIQF